MIPCQLYPLASKHVADIAAALGLEPVIQFEDFYSTVEVNAQKENGATYADLIRDIFGWSSRVPTQLINAYIRSGKLFVVQRGYEANVIDLTGAKITLPTVTHELMRTYYQRRKFSRTDTRERILRKIPPTKRSSGNSDSDYEYDGDNLLKKTVSTTTTSDGKEIRTETEYKYDTLDTGRKILVEEVTKKYVDDELDETTNTKYTPLQQGLSHQVTTDEDGDNGFYSWSLNYEHKWSESDKLNFILTNSRFKMDRTAIYEQSFDYPDFDEPDTYQSQDAHVKDKSWETQLDYEAKFADVVSFSTGYKGTFQDNVGPTETYSGTSPDDVVLDKSLYNDYSYKQNIHAGYVTIGSKVSQFSFMVGLRGEYWNFKTKSLSYSDAFEGTSPGGDEHDFFKLFPSAFVSYALPGNNELQINYTRRLRRPWGGQLNSFRNISDAQNISFGNPELTPEYSNAYELNYIKTWDSGQTLSTSLYYRTTDDVMQRIRFLIDDVMYQTEENVAHRKNTGMEVVGKNRFGSIFDLTTTLNMYYSVIDAFTFHPDVSWLEGNNSDVVVTGDKDEDFSWNVRAIAAFNLPKSITFQATGDYNARQMIAQGHRKAVYNLEFGAKKGFLKDKLIFNINGRNVLNSRRFHAVTSAADFHQDSKNWRNKRTFSFTATWNFGDMNMNKKRDRGRDNDEEEDQNRFSD